MEASRSQRYGGLALKTLIAAVMVPLALAAVIGIFNTGGGLETFMLAWVLAVVTVGFGWAGRRATEGRVGLVGGLVVIAVLAFLLLYMLPGRARDVPSASDVELFHPPPPESAESEDRPTEESEEELIY